MSRSVVYSIPDASRAEQLDSWTFPAYRHLLNLQPGMLNPQYGGYRHVSPLASVAEEGGRVVGLGLGCLPMGNDLDTRPAELLSILVHPRRRGQGIAGNLLDNLEGQVREHGNRRMEAVYMTGGSSIDHVEKLLASRGWSKPEMRMKVVRFSIEEAKSTPWYGVYKRRDQMEFFPWAEVTDSEMNALRKSHQESGWIAEDLVPWQFDLEQIEPHSSVGIRIAGNISGWVINHLMPDETVRFTCSFIHPRFKRRGRIIPAYTESLHRVENAGYSRCMLTAPAHHPQMVKFVERWCGPWVSFLGDTRGSIKILDE